MDPITIIILAFLAVSLSVAAFRADIKARFTPRASGALAGRNFFNA